MNGEIGQRIVMQPTSLCNLNCTYCYLAHRMENNKMSLRVAEAVARSIECEEEAFRITWHGGEPLSCGLAYFKDLLKPFDSLRLEGRVSHSIQTNATLINDEWCALFKEQSIHVGVSIDGPRWANRKRIHWNSKESYSHIMRGINFLKKHEIQFTAICVISEEGLGNATELYDFFCNLGCFEVGFNFEEKSGINNSSGSDNGCKVKRFWGELFLAWKENPIVAIRELQSVLSWMEAVVENETTGSASIQYQDLFPSIAHDGSVVLLSPEFLDVHSEYYNDFKAGNVLNQTLSSILSSGEELKYVADFRVGVEKCLKVCDYSEYCIGGQASNKFFELGSTNGTETTYCRNAKQYLVDGVLSAI